MKSAVHLQDDLVEPRAIPLQVEGAESVARGIGTRLAVYLSVGLPLFSLALAISFWLPGVVARHFLMPVRELAFWMTLLGGLPLLFVSALLLGSALAVAREMLLKEKAEDREVARKWLCRGR